MGVLNYKGRDAQVLSRLAIPKRVEGLTIP